MNKLSRKLILFVVKYFINPLFRSKFLAKIIFNVKFGPVGPEYYYFDISTIAIVKKLKEYVNKDIRLIDMGTGAFAVIGLSLWKKTGCHVLSVDINKNIIELAKKNIELNNAPIRVIHSDFFTNVDEDFDVVSWNPPYVHSVSAEYLNLADSTRSQWDGGNDGTTAIRRYLDILLKFKRKTPLKIYLCINAFYVSKQVMLDLIGIHKELSVDEVSSHYFSFFNVYVLTLGV